MPRKANGSGSIRKKSITKPNGKTYVFYEARVTIGRDPVTGKQKQKSISGKTQSEVRKKMSEMIYKVDSGTYADSSKILLSEWLTMWLNLYVEGKVKPYTVDSYRSICKTHIIPALGNTELRKLDTDAIQLFYNSLCDKLAPKTIKNVHGVLHRSLDKAVRLKKISTNPADNCELPIIEKADVKALEQENVSALLDIWKTHKYRRVYIVTVFTGLRQGEVLGLTWDCVDFKNNLLYINKQLQKTSKVGGQYYLPSTKNSQTRYVCVAPSIMQILKEQKEAQEHMKKIAGSAWNNEWNLVFTNEIGGHLTHVNVYKRFKNTVKKVGLDSTRFHDLRHTFAVASLESGDNIKTVQENLGHATASFTMDVYGHVSKRMHKASADNMERYISEIA